MEEGMRIGRLTAPWMSRRMWRLPRLHQSLHTTPSI